MRIGVVGTGHVGLVTCAALAHMGHEVHGTDSDAEKIAMIEDGRSPFHEPSLEDVLKSELKSGRLSVTSSMDEAVAGSEVVFLCVGTPARASGEANLIAVENAAREIARCATNRLVLVEKSTVPAGTATRLTTTLRRERADVDFEVASNPEFLREGRAVADSLEPDRILVGTESDWAREMMRRVYAPWTDAGYKLIETDIATAELAKHACNAFLSLKISFANALAQLCERAGADVVQVAEVMGSDPRIGPQFLRAGLGYGGYCFPKDLAAFDNLARSLGYDFTLLREIARINEEALTSALDKVRDVLWNLEGKRIALLGLSFKPDTDDVRLAPAIALARRLMDEGAIVVGYDPQALANAKAELPSLETASDAYDALTGAHCAVICTEWAEFAALDLGRVRDAMAYPVIIDGRNVFDPKRMRDSGIAYHPTGRPAVT